MQITIYYALLGSIFLPIQYTIMQQTINQSSTTPQFQTSQDRRHKSLWISLYWSPIFLPIHNIETRKTNFFFAKIRIKIKPFHQLRLSSKLVRINNTNPYIFHSNGVHFSPNIKTLRQEKLTFNGKNKNKDETFSSFLVSRVSGARSRNIRRSRV